MPTAWRVLIVASIAVQGASGQLAAKDSALAAEQRFLAKWDSLWKFSERDRHSFSVFGDTDAEDGARHQHYHCHPDPIGGGNAAARRRLLEGPAAQQRLIQSKHGYFAVCPSRDLGDVKTSIEERGDIDAALLEPRRTAARAAREALIARLDTAVLAMADDDLLIGQRVRFLVDQRDYGRALAAARACGGVVWWCGALAGYVHAARGEVVQAESAFVAALAAMPDEERCRWTDHRALFDAAGRDGYGGVSCAKRQSVNERLWWLADPLFIEPGNERIVEQYSRIVLLSLRTALERDERFAWNPRVGGDARHAMVMRYGWPSHIYWGGPLQDRSHSGYLASHHTPPAAPYTTY